MKSIFITRAGVLLPRWREAFEDGEVFPDFNVEMDAVSAGDYDRLIWVDVASFPEENIVKKLNEVTNSFKAKSINPFVIILTPAPNRREGLAAIRVGVRGYVHRLASVKQLKEAATVVSNSGLWLGDELLNNLVDIINSKVNIQNHDPSPCSAEHRLDLLTAKELEIAYEVGKGKSNREISERLNVSERTVKAHLTLVFKKLKIRDRVHLALLINDINVH